MTPENVDRYALAARVHALLAPELAAEGWDTDALLRGCSSPALGGELLARFAELVLGDAL